MASIAQDIHPGRKILRDIRPSRTHVRLYFPSGINMPNDRENETNFTNETVLIREIRFIRANSWFSFYLKAEIQNIWNTLRKLMPQTPSNLRPNRHIRTHNHDRNPRDDTCDKADNSADFQPFKKHDVGVISFFQHAEGHNIRRRANCRDIAAKTGAEQQRPPELCRSKLFDDRNESGDKNNVIDERRSKRCHKGNDRC